MECEHGLAVDAGPGGGPGGAVHPPVVRGAREPRWLANHGREDEARGILARIGGGAHAEQELGAIRAAMGEEAGRFSELFSRTYSKPLLIAVALMIGSQFCGINAIIYYSTKIFETAATAQSAGASALHAAASAAAVKRAAFEATAWVGLVNLLFTFVAIGLVDLAGRRPLLLAGTAVQTVALGLVGWMLHAHMSVAPLMACIMVFIAAFASAMGPIPWIFCSEIFPNKVRGRAMSIATFTIWSSCYVVAQTFPMLNDSKAVGPVLTFGLYGGVSLLTFIFVCLAVPETKGRTLEEIEASWRTRPR